MVYVFMAYITFYCFMFLGYVVCEFFQIIGNVKNFTNICIIDKNSFISGPIQLNPCCSTWASLSASHTHTCTYTVVYTCTLYIHVQLCMSACARVWCRQRSNHKLCRRENRKKIIFLNSFKISCRSHGSWHFMMLTKNVGR